MLGAPAARRWYAHAAMHELEVVGRMLGVKGGRTPYENMLEVLSYVVSFASFYIFVYLAKVTLPPHVCTCQCTHATRCLARRRHASRAYLTRSGRWRRHSIARTAAPGRGWFSTAWGRGRRAHSSSGARMRAPCGKENCTCSRRRPSPTRSPTVPHCVLLADGCP